MLDLRLPYFYNLPIAVLLGMSVVSRLERLQYFLGACDGGPELFGVIAAPGDTTSIIYLKTLLITLPAMTGAAYFSKQFMDRSDVYVRETLYILGVINFLGYLIPSLLR